MIPSARNLITRSVCVSESFAYAYLNGVVDDAPKMVSADVNANHTHTATCNFIFYMP